MIVVEARLQGFTEIGSMGVVKDTTFINCHWPKLDRPTRLFSPGSTGVKVMGRTPRNVWFPDDVEFLTYYPDALYPAEQAVLKAAPSRRVLVNLTAEEAQIWLDAYTSAVARFPKTHTILQTARAVNFLRLKEETADARTEEFVAELTPQECVALVDGLVSESALRESKQFVHLTEYTRDGEAKIPLTLEAWKDREGK